MTFSVLIAVYGQENPLFFKDALDSVLCQTLLPSEIVLIKDGPLTSELDAVIDTYCDLKPELFNVITLEVNMGLGKALKVGLESCANEIVLRMDSDDICYPNRFAKQIEMLVKKPEVSVLGTSIQEFEYVPGDLKRYRKLPLDFSQLRQFAKYRNPLNHPSVAFRKSHVLQAGSYQDMPLFEDFYLWARLIQRGFIVENLTEPLLHFRVGNDMVGRRHGFSYFAKEYRFLSTLRKIQFLTLWEFLISIVTKLPLRLLPKKILELLYKKLLR